ncbi:MAG: carbohydrate kinase family protein [Candidatus Acidiferrales bacterium]
MRDHSPFAEIVGLGLNAADTLIRVPHFPAPDSKLQFRDVRVQPGGEVATALVACSRWGLSTRYIGKVGDDDAGRMQAEEFARSGVETRLMVVADCKSQSSFILVDESAGERTIIWNRDARLEIRPEELQREWFEGARALHLNGNSTAAMLLAARWARESGAAVTIDVDSVYLGIEVVLEFVDYLIASREFPARLTGDTCLLTSLPTLQRTYHSRLTAATLGRDGVLAWDGDRFLYCPAFDVDTVDTTGAGDIFHGGFLYALLKGWDLERALEFSCAAAALNCTVLGARGGIRPVEEIEKLRREGRRRPRVYSQVELEEARTGK